MKTILFSILVVVILSCKKENDSTTLTVTGTWDVTFTYGTGTRSGPMVITQHSDNTLTGTFDWGGRSLYFK